jgi:hypothetical protein
MLSENARAQFRALRLRHLLDVIRRPRGALG